MPAREPRTFRASGNDEQGFTDIAAVTEADAVRGGMHIPLRQLVLDEVVQVIALVEPLVFAVARKDRDLASQIRRAVSSVGLNVAEGFGTAAGNERLRFQRARGSLYEAHAGLRMAVAWRYLSAAEAAAALAALDHLGGRIYGLIRK